MDNSNRLFKDFTIQLVGIFISDLRLIHFVYNDESKSER